MSWPGDRHPAPALLLDATWYGTLAATRDLGARGVPVVLGLDSPTAPARFSRHATRSVPAPSTADAARLIDWLHTFGEREPGHALPATSDDVAFVIAAHADSLRSLFRLATPTLPALLAVLDKSRLSAAATRAGLDSPQVWAPADEGALEAMLDDIAFPVIVKPRAQTLARVWTKGIRVHRREDLLPAWRRVRDGVVFDPLVTAIAPEVTTPVVQALHEASEEIYTVDGFATADGEILGTLACTKTLQVPRRSGPGICFAAAEVDPQIADGLARLCRQTGVHGVFDVEFIVDGDRRLLIDFNPRFYNHMAFEIDRGLPLAYYAYLAAAGEHARLRAEADAARLREPSQSGVYIHRLLLAMMLAAQTRPGGMNAAERARWRSWRRRHRGGVTDPAGSWADPLPVIADWVHVADQHVVRKVRRRISPG